MTAPEVVVVRSDAATTPLPDALPFAVGRVVDASTLASPEALAAAADLERSSVLWLPPWTRLDAATLDAIMTWLAATRAGAPRVARARLELACGSASFVAGERVVLSDPGAVRLDGDRPEAAPGVPVVAVAAAWRAELPPLREHLEAVNLQTTAAARLRHVAGEQVRWSALSSRPLAFVLRALSAARGSRRVALPHLVVEAYREVLVAAKLWELAHVPGHA